MDLCIKSPLSLSHRPNALASYGKHPSIANPKRLPSFCKPLNSIESCFSKRNLHIQFYSSNNHTFRKLPAISTAFQAQTETTEQKSQVLVDELLQKLSDSDRGAVMNEEQKAVILSFVEELEKYSISEPLKSPLIFGEWDVAYTSSPTSAGGGYRSMIGRAFLKADEIVQTICQPNVVKNKVSFNALGFIPGVVSLQGTFEALDERWIKVTFQPPNLDLGFTKFTYSKTSQVQISITYLDERVRIGRGSRGSIFVFKRR